MKGLPSAQTFFILAVAALVFTAIIRNPLPTGYAVFDSAQVLAGKESYQVGDLVHLFVMPASIDYNIEVYDPDNNLYAMSENFPAEKPGKYTVKAVLSFNGEEKEVTATFDVASKEPEEKEEEVKIKENKSEEIEQPEEETEESEETSESIEEINETAEDNITEENIPEENITEENIPPEEEAVPEFQVAADVNDIIKDEENNAVGKKIEDEPDYETFFTFVGRSRDNFVLSFYHNSTSAQPIWIEGDISYSLSMPAAQPNETVNLTVTLVDGRIPKFRLHVGPDSDVFEFGITVLNLKSYPQVGGYWTVEFNTTGTANLTITAIDSTEFTRDLEFTELRCGNTLLDAQYDDAKIFYPDYSCAETGYEKSHVLTSGKHTLLFEFGDATATAQNYATNYVCNGCTYTTLYGCMNAINNTDAGCFINQSNIDYEMNTDFSYYMPLAVAAEAVIKINATNVTVDCNGSAIIGNNVGYGVFLSNFSNATIKNCEIFNFSYGIYAENSNYSNISSNVIHNTTSYGIYLENVSYSSLSNNTVVNNSGSGVYTYGSSNNSIINNTMSANWYHGLYLAANSNDTLVKNNDISGNWLAGIWVYGAGNNTFINNSINGNDDFGFYAESAPNIVLINNTINNTNGYGIDIWSSNNILTSNTISNNGYGIYMALGNNNTLTGNIANNNTDTGIGLDSSRNNTLTNNTANSNVIGFGFYDSSFNAIINNTANNNTATGMYLGLSSVGSQNNTFRNNTMNYNLYGMYMESSSNNNTVIFNIMQNNSYGIVFESGASNNTIKNNTLEKNQYGIYNVGSYNFILENIINNNTAGIYLEDSSYNVIANNTINNTAKHALNISKTTADGSPYNNITGNIILNTASGRRDILLNATNTSIWLNSFYSRGVNNTNSVNTLFCVNNEGNFYEDNIDISYMGNGTGEGGATIGGDCGPANLTHPFEGDTLTAGTSILTWKKQSSQNTINYSLFYSNDTGTTWYFINATTGLSYNWSTIGYVETDYYFKIIPFDGTYNATKDNASFTLEMNEQVCSNITLCEYPNITSALYYENNTNNVIYLVEDNITYLLSGSGTYNLLASENTPAIRTDATNVTLNCNYGKIIGSATGYGVFIDSIDDASIRKCYVYNYSTGILVKDADNTYVQNNLISNSTLSDLNLTGSTNSKISHNSFYSKGVNGSAASNSFCVMDYNAFGIAAGRAGNFYEQSINRSYMENTLHDCGLTNITRPQQNINYSRTINLSWTSQSNTIDDINYSISYSNNTGTSWHFVTATTALSYLWDISGMPDLSNYLLNVIPFDSLRNATNATSFSFGMDSSPPSISIINQTNSSNVIVNSSNPSKSGEVLTINVNASDTYGLSAVWIKFWSSGVNLTSIWGGSFSRVSGSIYDGVWGLNATINESFPEYGSVNYTVYANDSTGNSVSNTSNFTIIDNEWLCANASLCEYQSLSQALLGENNTNSTILLTDSNVRYTSDSAESYRFTPRIGNSVLNFNASNITVDCKGSVIGSNHSGYGAYTNGFKNITLINCSFGRFYVGINFTNSTNSNISFGSSFNNIFNGLWLNNFNDGYISYLNISNNTRDGIFLLKSNRTIIKWTNITKSSGAGINITNSSYDTLADVNSTINTYSALYIGPLSNYITVENSSFSNSTSASLLMIYGSNSNITSSTFRNSSSGYYDIFIDQGSLSNNIWLNNFYGGGVLDNSTSTYCVYTPTRLLNSVYTTQYLKLYGNYYSNAVNSTYGAKGSCGNLTEPFDDSDNDGYYSIVDDCNNLNRYTYPGATEYCDDFDNNCDGIIDENACALEKFPSAGSSSGGGSGGAAIAGYSTEGKRIEQDIAANPVAVLYRGETLSFNVKGKEQSVVVNKIYFDKVKLSISDVEGEKEINIQDSQSFDLDNDGLSDLQITLSSIEGSSAVLELKEVTQEIKPEVTIGPEQAAEGAAKEAEKPAAEEKPALIEIPSSISAAAGKALGIGKKILKYSVIIIISLAIIISIAAGAASYTRFMGNVKKAEDYVNRALASRVPETKIRRKLIEAGWEPQVVDSIIRMESKARMKKELEDKIGEAVKEGISKEDIKKSLIEKGWEESEIKKIVK